LPSHTIESSKKMMQLLGNMSNLIGEIEQAENEEKIKKILDDSDVKLLMDTFEETVQSQNQLLLDDISMIKMKFDDEIEIHNNIVKILNSVDIQNPKINELIQKENELIDIFKKRIDFSNQMYSQIKMIEDMLLSLKEKEKLEIEIKQLAKEVDLDDILSDK
jgi:oligoendopeptidase F